MTFCAFFFLEKKGITEDTAEETVIVKSAAITIIIRVIIVGRIITKTVIVSTITNVGVANRMANAAVGTANIAMNNVLIPPFAQMIAGKSQTSVIIRITETTNELYQKATTLITRRCAHAMNDWNKSYSDRVILASTLTSTKTYPWKRLATKCHQILIRSMTLS